MKVNLSDVIEAIEFEGELLSHYYNKKTGIIIYLEDNSTSNYKAEDINNLENFEEWEKELISGLYDLKENFQDYIQLPNKDEINECNMMIDFCKSLGDENFTDKNLEELQEEYSLRKLREHIENIGQLSEWYDYREKAEYQLATDWCKKNNIEYIE
ncbi:hypothetical protein FDE76_08710 [Clostridium botulinum]|uniref:Uncharacterized protein n=1 Tax=Clostridium botulinum (strain Eklund 17B / Type B) TaxID=935198 RepID=B2TJQ4_CLOBB|nr:MULTISPECIES: hypothetical protein [unclassified Clostridium]ACD22961.1 hypothetical protein CLL_A1443 [Clostridium botulinum B str. Eklund 17B (NRP)]MBN1038332.1 hypothetical protein [Clostridium botulinum]MBN1051809.1 hypothetical protein [Clostridium botulinum]MBY6974745.1 hypothetical protein [Clostridium botulinum]MBY6999731.1 hypothetical protein [Clostridium botulinum]